MAPGSMLGRIVHVARLVNVHLLVLKTSKAAVPQNGNENSFAKLESVWRSRLRKRTTLSR